MGKNIKAAFGRSSFSVCTVIIKIDKMKNKALRLVAAPAVCMPTVF